MDKNDRSISARIQKLIAVGGIPGAIVGLIGDFFNPSGGWIIAGLLGATALILATYFLMSLSLKSDHLDEIWWIRKFFQDEGTKWFWTAKPAFLSHGIHLVIVFGVVCLFLAQKSFAASSHGGLLSKNIDAVAVAQKQLGIAKEILDQQKKTNVILGSIDSKADNFKRESSEDPRKELANRGILWGASQFGEAINADDAITVELFLKGGIRISSADVLRATSPMKPSIIELLIQHKHLYKEADCRSVFVYVINKDSFESTDANIIRLVKALCSYDSNRIYVNKELKDAEARHAEKIKMYKTALANKKPAKECVRELMKDGGSQILQEASQFNILSATTLKGRQVLLANLNKVLVFGGSEADIKAAINKFCEDAGNIKPPYDVEGREVTYWKTILKWTT